jgi:Cd2+/Zn2+-exporting ATPase
MEIRNYQVQRFENKNNFRRIELKIKKLPFVKLVKCDKDRGVIYLELNETPDGFEEMLLKIINIYEKKAIISEKSITGESFRSVLFLKGLDCAHCAANIEKEAKAAFNHEKITVDFATSRFIIETKDKALIDNITDEVAKITAKVDPRVVVMDLKQGRKEYQEETEEKFDTTGLILFFIGVGILVIIEVLRLVFHSFFDDHYYVFLPFYFISYGLVGYKVIYRSVKNFFSRQFFDENFLMTIASIGAFIIGYNEEAVFVLVFYQIGDFLQSKAVNHSRRSIRELLSID